MTTTNSQVLGSTDLAELFKEAQDTFLASLSEEERRSFPKCSSAEELVESARKLDILSRGHRDRKAMLRKIQAFGNKLSPFFGIIDILCSAHPEWANVAWGAFRLVLQMLLWLFATVHNDDLTKRLNRRVKLASNFGTFFENLCETLDQLAAEFPQWTEIYISLGRDKHSFSQRLPEALVRFYTCMFDFLHSVSRVFIRKDGKPKKTSLYVANIMRQPFSTRFQDILKKMKACREIVLSELNLALRIQLRNNSRQDSDYIKEKLKKIDALYDKVVEVKSEFTEAAKERFDQTLRGWLSAPAYRSAFDNARDRKHEGTAEWLLDEPVFQSWNQPHGSSDCRSAMLWVHGNPGSGKTILAASIIDLLQEKLSESELDSYAVCYFFFDATELGSNTRLGAYRALATQIYQQHGEIEQVRDIFAFAARNRVDTASEKELLDILQLAVSILPNIFLIIDGVDECSEDTQLVSDLHRLCGMSKGRVALFSRPTVVALRYPKSPISSISMLKHRVNSDMAIFFTQELQDLTDLGLFPQHLVDGEMSSMVMHLVSRAEGMFLWARLMILYLSSPALTPRQRLAIVQRETPEGIGTLYENIFSMIKNQDKPSQLLARQVFLWCTHAYSNLTAQQMRCVVSEGGLHGNPDDLLVDIDHAVIMSCRGLIEKRLDGCFHFIHITAKDFISARTIVSSAGVDFTTSAWSASCEITTACIKYMTFAIPLQPLSTRMGTSAVPGELRESYPFLEYASLKWAHHLKYLVEKAEYSSELDQPAHLASFEACLDTLKRFLNLKLNIMLWIEAVYTFEGGAELIKSCAKELKAAAASLVNLLTNDTFTSSRLETLYRDISEFAVDILEIEASWNSTLCSRPHEIWGDVTLFTQSRFLQPTSAASLECLSAGGQSGNGNRKARFSVSETSSDGQRMAVLSVWPSELFEMLWTGTGEFRNIMSNDGNLYDPSIQLDFKQDPSLSPKLCKGWKATYEIYRIGDNSTRLCLVGIPLEEEEVSMQLRQSLRGFMRNWKLNFPLAISPSLSVITILRSVYTAKVELSRTTNQLTVQVSTPAILDTSHIDPDGAYWSERRAHFELPYLYNIKIGCNDGFLIFQDEDLGFRSKNDRSIAVFSLYLQQGEPAVRYIDCFSYRISIAGGSLCVLHNRYPMVLFAAFKDLYAWNLEATKLGHRYYLSPQCQHQNEREIYTMLTIEMTIRMRNSQIRNNDLANHHKQYSGRLYLFLES
ncbi:uncharacterized protein TRIVIDRAFT_210425 [Trichoderma virens Gv29-8]|uniref:NACHT domain-containing protein n=1 Tax=Hypocrea virens (strain Gv29-8 / FGSC 10586) TaxID=413071 RepID=G9N680_HYPVG|nr:uncharacterized protein TRIVIDRAFT_210425 [Trichoderma virens Gv29-8]EHK17642.1 hypothetical protein TRIVIDRAFT_210425 [Trichoderma virens Gv29-8]